MGYLLPMRDIYPEDDVPAGQEAFVKLNAELSKEWEGDHRAQGRPSDAKDWEGKPGQIDLIQR